MTVLRFEYILSGSLAFVEFSNLEVERMVITTNRKQVIQQLENRKHIQYVIGFKFFKFTLTLEQNPDVIAKIDLLRAVQGPIVMHYSYNKDASKTKLVKIDPNMSVSYFAGYLSTGQIVINFIETYSAIPGMLQMEVAL